MQLQRRAAVVFLLYMLSLLLPLIQIYKIITDEKITASSGQGTVTLDICTPRGTIYDCNMKPLTNTEQEYVAIITPTLDAIREVREKLPEELAETTVKRLEQGMPVKVSVPEGFSAIGARVFTVNKHNSDYQTAAHIVGYLDSTGKNGVTGIELGYNSQLSFDENFSVTFDKNAAGRVLEGSLPRVNYDNTITAKGVCLTIDSEIQALARDAALGSFESGAVVVLSIPDGKIRAMVSLPEFSPVNLNESLNDVRSPLINRAISPYNAGSVYKLCVAAAALESGSAGGFDFTCHSQVKIGTNIFKCSNEVAHGALTLEKALEVSCNCYFITLAGKTGAEPIINMSKAFGFGKTLNLGGSILTKKGSLPELALLESRQAMLANLAIGQGDLLLTPLSVAVMAAAIATGGEAPAPTLIEGEVSEEGVFTPSDFTTAPVRVMSKNTAATLKSYMINVVETGTGKAAKPEEGGAGGKTGTAQTGWIKDGRAVEQAWFCGFFPADEPRYVIAALAEDGKTGGSTSGPVFKRIADGIAEFEKNS